MGIRGKQNFRSSEIRKRLLYHEFLDGLQEPRSAFTHVDKDGSGTVDMQDSWAQGSAMTDVQMNSFYCTTKSVLSGIASMKSA